MKRAWRRLAERIDALALRERIFVFAGAVALVLAVGFSLVVDPATSRNRSLQRQALQKQSEASALQSRMLEILQGRQNDPNRAARTRLAELDAELARLDQRIGAEERKFTAPSQMRRVIEEMLSRNRRVKLVDLKTLPAASIEERVASGAPSAAPAAKPAASTRRVYRHGMELTVSGSYLDLLGYLSDLERLPTQLYWGSLDVDATGYPHLAMKLTVFTLSLDPAWMDV